MSEQDKPKPYVYQPYGFQEEHYVGDRKWGIVTGWPGCTIKGLAKGHAEDICDYLKTVMQEEEA